LLLTAKAKEDSPGNQCAGGHTAGSRPKRFESAAADILRGPSTQRGAGARLQPKKDSPGQPNIPGAANPDSALGDEIACKTNTLVFGTGLVLISVDRDCLCSKWKTFSQQGD
jgi:hypothetical protein